MEHVEGNAGPGTPASGSGFSSKPSVRRPVLRTTGFGILAALSGYIAATQPAARNAAFLVTALALLMVSSVWFEWQREVRTGVPTKFRRPWLITFALLVCTVWSG